MFSAGSRVDPYELRPYSVVGLGLPAGNSNLTGKTLAVKSDAGINPMVIGVFGQSNSCNVSSTLVTPATNPTKALNFSIMNGAFYRTSDPLLGCFGTGGNWATRLHDKIQASGSLTAYTGTILVPFGVGGASVAEWETDIIGHRIEATAARLAVAGLTVTHFLWHQGERDNVDGTSAGAYTASFRNVVARLRTAGFTNAKVILAKASMIGGGVTSSAVRTGQTNSASTPLGIYLGPDTDVYDATYREASSGIHFNATGQNAVATDFTTALGVVG